MLSLKKSIPEPSDVSRTALRALGLLIQGLELHTPDRNREDLCWFRAGMVEAQQKAGQAKSGEEVIALVGDVIRDYQEYNRRSDRKLNQQFAELREIIRTLTAGVAQMVGASNASLERLTEIQARLAAADAIDELQNLQGHLSTCLSEMAEEVRVHRNSSQGSMTHLAAQAEQLEQAIETAAPKEIAYDVVTGLAGRAEAERALEASAESAGSVAAAFVVRRLSQVNLRYGYQTGDKLLSHLSTYFGSAMQEHDELYRWTGPVLVALLRRDATLQQIRHQILRLVVEIPEYELHNGSRLAMIAPSVGWSVFPVAKPVSHVVRQVETFVANQSLEGDHVHR
jgi:GGDEF domain-containing protein